MITYVPNPYLLDFERWADEITRQDSTFPTLDGFSDWREWAAHLSLLSGFDVSTVPNPYETPDWREWAAGLEKVIGA